MDARAALTALLVATLVLAGCVAPGTAPAGRSAPTVEVRNASGATVGTTIPTGGNASVDPGVVFSDLESMLGTDVRPPDYVVVLDDLSGPGGNLSGQPSRVWRLMDVRTRAPNRSIGHSENGATSILGHVTVYPGENRTERSVRWVLAHELVHYIQLHENRWEQVRNATDLETTDGQFAYRAMLEGPAVWGTDAYLRRYAPSLALTEPFYDELISVAPPGSHNRYGHRAYAFGNDYVEARVDDPRNLSTVFADPARTSEQVLHGLDPAAEPPVELRVHAHGSDAWAPVGRDRMGEAFLWSALASNVSVDRARRAAAGWGNDSLRIYGPSGDGPNSLAWALRFDNESEAAEFGRVARDYFDHAGTAAGEHWRIDGGAAALRQVDGRTYVLLLGDPGFVTGTAVSAADGVTIDPPGA
ncbi:MAG: hypothetical protein ABEJ89_03410 [Haloarculaceae archaeon]